MPFRLKNTPSEFQNIMNDVIAPISHFTIAYIDDVLIFSKSLDQHISHLHKFHTIIRKNGLAIFAPKMKLFHTHIRFLEHNIYQSTIRPITRVLEFTSKFPDEIKDNTQL